MPLAELAAAALVIALTACSGEPHQPSYSLAAQLSVADRSPAHHDDMVLEFAFELPTHELGLPYAQLAVTPSGVILVQYLDTCHWRTFNLETRKPLRTFGHCGGSAGFGQVSGAAALNDFTILAYDLRTSHLIIFDTSGVILRRYKPDELITATGTQKFRALRFVDDSTFLVSFVPSDFRSGSVSLLDLDGRPGRTLFPLTSQARPEQPILASGVRACAAHWDSSHPVIVGSNSWLAEALVVTPNATPVWWDSLGVPWTHPIRYGDHIEAGAAVRNPLCSGGGVMLRYAHVVDPVHYNANPDRSGYVEFRDSTGARRWSVAVDTSNNYLLRNAAAAWHDYFIFANRSPHDPALLVFRLRQKTPADTSTFIAPPVVKPADAE